MKATKNPRIRTEIDSDRGAIRKVHEAAFGNSQAAELVDLLRERGKAALSLVAVWQDRIVGHVLFSPVSVAGAPDSPQIDAPNVLGLGPVSVLPEFQNRGFGSRLIEHGLEECRRFGCPAVVVLGHPSYYPRFGFERASGHGLSNEYNVDDAFMVTELIPNTLGRLHGLVRYAPEFAESEC